MVKLSAEQAAKCTGQWFIAYTKNNCEFKAKDNFAGNCLVPVTQMIVKKGGQSRAKIVPKFRNYIYVQHDGTREFFEKVLANEYIQYLPGMTLTVLPLPVPEPDITHTVEEESKNTVLKRGDAVQIIDGYLKNLSGLIVGMQEQHEFIVEIKVFDRQIREIIPREYLIRIEE